MVTVVELKPHVRAKLGKLKNIYLNCEKTATIAAMHLEDELTTGDFTRDTYFNTNQSVFIHLNVKLTSHGSSSFRFFRRSSTYCM